MKDHQLPLPALSDPLQIGSVAIRNRAVLAPMSGVTDLPFRQLAWRFGAGLVVTEMVASRELVANKGESWARLKNAGMTPHMVQLAGREAHWMAEAAKIAADNGADIIDINMGCPAKKVTGGYSGSALMRDPDYALGMIEATVEAVDVPVTVKMRLGWDENSLNAPEIASRAEAAGAQLITIHGRTRMQFYEGRADWDAIRAVRDVISVPLIANGDVETAHDVSEILRRSGADAVMVGRGAQGQPWLPAVLAGHDAPAREAIADIAIEHYEMMLEFYGVEAGLRHARKHLGWYLDRFAPEMQPGDKGLIMTSKNTSEVIAILRSALESSAEQAAARKAA
ncbi:tRNA dihydrouridine synthase DusB [Agrobacterium larrymoorei]|uniref:tRNA-dihydrouridine synthase n=1 Tax=Agrobacterium larrymoorei TaxID=160699 RepID=A0AAF0H7M2_9HYPH|nr:tRNA dihydrouridine synthase DusB [Agrobacterium larrymoorei]WHA39855.1 tRNA dihydrouridine synthase DusB [Agrobacterium larrymoorei]